MAQQNIYDDEIFFEGYKKIRDNKINANNLFEKLNAQPKNKRSCCKSRYMRPC